jgi:hypothetical protein
VVEPLRIIVASPFPGDRTFIRTTFSRLLKEEEFEITGIDTGKSFFFDRDRRRTTENEALSNLEQDAYNLLDDRPHVHAVLCVDETECLVKTSGGNRPHFLFSALLLEREMLPIRGSEDIFNPPSVQLKLPYRGDKLTFEQCMRRHSFLLSELFDQWRRKTRELERFGVTPQTPLRPIPSRTVVLQN